MWFAHNPLQLRATATEKLLLPGSYSGTTITSLVSTVLNKNLRGVRKTRTNYPHLPQQALWVKVGLSHRQRHGEAAASF